MRWNSKGAVLDIYVHGDSPQTPTHQAVTVESVTVDYHGTPVWIELAGSTLVPWAAIRFISVIKPAPDSEPF